MIHRIHELENLPPRGIPDNLFRSAMIEVKALRLLDFQRQVRSNHGYVSPWLPCVSIVTSRDPVPLKAFHYPRDGTEPPRVQEA